MVFFSFFSAHFKRYRSHEWFKPTWRINVSWVSLLGLKTRHDNLSEVPQTHRKGTPEEKGEKVFNFFFQLISTCQLRLKVP